MSMAFHLLRALYGRCPGFVRPLLLRNNPSCGALVFSLLPVECAVWGSLNTIHCETL
jgi:hypothetical protein